MRRGGSTFREVLAEFENATNPVTWAVYRQILISRLWRGDTD